MELSEGGPRVSSATALARALLVPTMPRFDLLPKDRGGVVNPDSHVLVVEDDAGISALLKTILETEGYEVTSARNGQEALQFLDAGAIPCLILLDLEMPVMNGWELKGKLAADPRFRDIPVAVMSASEERLNSFHGSLRRLKKPFHVKDLIRAVGEHCAPSGAGAGECKAP